MKPIHLYTKLLILYCLKFDMTTNRVKSHFLVTRGNVSIFHISQQRYLCIDQLVAARRPVRTNPIQNTWQ
jgi:hypothetical protein